MSNSISMHINNFSNSNVGQFCVKTLKVGAGCALVASGVSMVAIAALAIIAVAFTLTGSSLAGISIGFSLGGLPGSFLGMCIGIIAAIIPSLFMLIIAAAANKAGHGLIDMGKKTFRQI